MQIVVSQEITEDSTGNYKTVGNSILKQRHQSNFYQPKCTILNYIIETVNPLVREKQTKH